MSQPIDSLCNGRRVCDSWEARWGRYGALCGWQTWGGAQVRRQYFWRGDSERCVELTEQVLPSSSQTRGPLQEPSIGGLLRRTGAVDQSW